MKIKSEHRYKESYTIGQKEIQGKSFPERITS